MAPRASSLLLVAVVLALLLVAGLRSTTLWSPVAPPPQPAAKDAAAAAASHALADDQPFVPTAELQRNEPSGDPASSPRVSLRIACVFAGDGRAAAGAEVHASEQPIPPERTDVERLLRARGRATTTDPAGRATVTVGHGSVVCVRSGEHFGLLRCDDLRVQSRFEQRIELERDLTARVLVRDAEGRPVPDLSLLATWERQEGWVPKRVLLPPTDADGVTLLSHAQTSFYRWEWQQSRALVIAPDGLTSPEPTCRVTHAMLLAGDPIQVTVPVGGTLRVRIEDVFGQPVVTRLFADDRAAGTDAAGLAVFQQMPLGRTWSLRRATGTGEPVALDGPQATVAGPERPGQLVTHRVVVKASHLRLRGTLRRSDGQPLGALRVNARLDRGSPPGADVPLAPASGVENTGNGSFVVRVECPEAAESVDGWLLVDAASLAEPWTHRIPAAKLARPDATGVVDVGVIEVPVDAEAPPLLRVTVRHADGSAVGDDVVAIADANAPQQQLRLLRSADGDTFTFRGRSEVEEFVVTVRGNGQLAAPPQRCRRGEAILVTLRPAATLLVPVSWPDSVRSQARAVLTSLATGAATTGGHSGDGFVAFGDLEPGAYRLTFRWQQRVLHDVPQIWLRAGDNLHPADGVPLDLRSAIQLVSVEVAPELASRDAKFALVPTGATDVATTPPIRVARLVELRPEPHDLLVASTGFVPQRLGPLGFDLRVELLPSTRLQFSVLDPRGEPIVRIAVLRDGVDDPVLRAFDHGNLHGPRELAIADPVAVTCAPGTELELTLVRSGVAGPVQRVVVGTTSPQEVALR